MSPFGDDDSFATATPVSLPRAVSGVTSPGADVDHTGFSLGGSGTLKDAASEIEASIAYLAETADYYEKAIFHTDQY